MNPIAFRLFGQPVYWYGILISAGVLLGILLAMRNARVFGVDQDSIVDLALLAIPLAIIGARLYYVVFEWDQYRGNLLDIINIRKGGLAIYGGVIGGALAGLIFSRWKKQDFWNLADICAPSLILGQAIGRWGNYVNQEAYGYAVKNPDWQWFPAAVYIEKSQQWHLATFFYESAWNFIVFFILMSYRKRRKKTGEVFLLYLILYSVGRFFIEGLRTDSLYLGNIRISQLLSVILFVLGIVMIVYRRKQESKASVELAEADSCDTGSMSNDACSLPDDEIKTPNTESIQDEADVSEAESLQDEADVSEAESIQDDAVDDTEETESDESQPEETEAPGSQTSEQEPIEQAEPSEQETID